MNKLELLLQQLHANPDTVEFQEVIDVIENSYRYTPVRFSNGPADECTISEAGVNEGSCKIFSFAQKHNLSERQTLHCFGRYYREDVLNFPNRSDHANIRTFIKYGWQHLHFEKPALD